MPASKRSGTRVIFSSVTASHWLSGDWGKCVGRCYRGFAEEVRGEEFLLMIIWCWSWMEKTVYGQPVSFPLVLVAREGRSGCLWSVRLWAFDWQTCWIAIYLRRLLECASHVQNPSAFPRHLGLRSVLQQSSWRRPVRACVRATSSGPPSVWSQCFDPPPPTPTIERCQQSFPHCLPRKACCAASQNTVYDVHG